MTTPVVERPKCVSDWLRTQREYVMDGVYRSRFNEAWLYSIYGEGKRAYHQVISPDRIKIMKPNDVVNYMRSMRDIALKYSHGR